MKKLLTFLATGSVVTLIVLFCGIPTYCAIPHLINYQGMLTDELGNPLSGPHNLTFRVYDDTTGGDLEWSETQNGVQVEQGLFNVILGQVTLLDLPFDEQYWLEVQVDDNTMPRIKFTSVGYAYRALVADSAAVTGSGTGGAGGWIDDGSVVILETSTDNVGIGTTTPGVKLHIEGGGDAKVNIPNTGYLIIGSSTEPHIAIDNNEILAKSTGDSIGNLYIQWSTEAKTLIHGKVGIGTDSPENKLEVVDGSMNGRLCHYESAMFPVAYSIYSGVRGTYGENVEGSLGRRYDHSLGGTAYYGIYGRAETSGKNYGVYGSASGGSTNWAGYFDGDVCASILKLTGGSDIAEPFDVKKTDVIQAGMVLTIDPENPGKLRISEKAYDRCVAGIISGAGNIQPGMLMGQSGSVADGEYPVALTGRVYCWADASNGSIKPGDLLTTSDNPGHAMKVTEYARSHGAVIGKAMSSLEEGQGLILVLVTLQ